MSKKELPKKKASRAIRRAYKRQCRQLSASQQKKELFALINWFVGEAMPKAGVA